MNVDVSIDIFFRSHRVALQVFALQRYICLPDRQLMFWHMLKQLGAELVLAGKDKISHIDTKIPQQSKLVSYCASSSAYQEERSEPWKHCVAPAHYTSAGALGLWDRAANSGNTSGVGAGCSIYNNTTTYPRCQTLVPTELSAREGAAVAEHILFLYKQHRLGPYRARLCIRTGHRLRTLWCFYKQYM